MSQEHLSGLTVISIKNTVSPQLSNDDVINDFASRMARKSGSDLSCARETTAGEVVMKSLPGSVLQTAQSAMVTSIHHNVENPCV